MIAVTGATGFVGQAVLDLAATRGLPIRALTRQPQKPRNGVEWIAGDLEDTAALAKLVAGAESVIHIAGVVNAPDAAGFTAGNVAGTLEVVTAAMVAGTPRFIHVSSLSAREPQLSDYGASKLKASGSSWPARSTGPWCARPQSMAHATARCWSCSSSPRPDWCRCRRADG